MEAIWGAFLACLHIQDTDFSISVSFIQDWTWTYDPKGVNYDETSVEQHVQKSFRMWDSFNEINRFVD